MTKAKGHHNRTGRADEMRQKVMLLLVPVLAIVLWLLVRNSIPTTSAMTADAEDTPATQYDEMKATSIDWQIPPLYRIGDRDPMQLAPMSKADEKSVAADVPSPTGLVLRGILYTAEKPVAMIGSTLVLEGQQIGPVKVLQIARDSVEFEMNGRRWRQTVVNPTIAPPSDNQQERETAPHGSPEVPQ